MATNQESLRESMQATEQAGEDGAHRKDNMREDDVSVRRRLFRRDPVA